VNSSALAYSRQYIRLPKETICDLELTTRDPKENSSVPRKMGVPRGGDLIYKEPELSK
jgi:hypothetical protein